MGVAVHLMLDCELLALNHELAAGHLLP